MKHLFVLKCCLFAIVLWPRWDPVCAQGLDATLSQLNHRAYGLQDGAPGFIGALAQTPDGMLWIGGRAGLIMFDGVRFSTYPGPQDDPLPTTKVSSLHATSDGGLWVGHTLGGISFLKNGHVVVYDDPEVFAEGRTVLRIASDPDGLIWAVTSAGLVRFDGKRWHKDAEAAKLQMPLGGFLFDRAGTLWVTSAAGVWMRARGDTAFRQAVAGSFEGRVIGGARIDEAPNGEIWVTRGTELIRIEDPRTVRGVHVVEVGNFKGSFRRWIRFDRDGNLWMPDFGLSRVRFEHPGRGDKLTVENLLFEKSQADDFALSFLQDREGNVWIGTRDGLDRFTPSNVLPYPTDCTPGAYVPNANGSVWLHCQAEDATMLSREGRVLVRHRTPDFSVGYRDEAGTVWFGGNNVLARVDEKGVVFESLPPEARNAPVQALVRDREGALWVSVAIRGLFRLHDGVWDAFGNLPELPRRPPSVATLAPDGALWFGYLLNRVARVKSGKVTVFDARAGLNVGNVLSISARDDEVLVGGELGLSRLDGQRFNNLHSADIPMRGISGIVRDSNGGVWLHSLAGISHITATEFAQAVSDPSQRLRMQNFDHLDGVPGTAMQLRPLPSATADDDGLLWFSTEGGLVTVDPRRQVRNALPPPVRIWAVTSDGQRHRNRGERIDLPAHIDRLQITYGAGSLTVPERVRFRYRLEGREHNWQDAGNRREAVYTNLGPGNYRFRVIAANNDGVWNEEGASIDFHIAPTFYQTGWFYALCVLATAMFLFALYRWRVKVLSRKLELETAANQEHARLYRELQERESMVRRLFNANIIGIFTWNLDGRILDANHAFVKIVGYDSDDITSGRLAWKDLMPPEWDSADDRIMAEMLAIGVATPFEADYIRKDGTRVPVLIGAALLDARPTEGVAFVLDLTERNQAEQAVRESDRRFHEMERQLSDANRVASIAQLSATIAHEINQPLAGVITNASTGLRMLDADPPNIEGARKTAQRTIRDGNRAADVIVRLRALFSGKVSMLEPLDMNEATREVIAMMAGDLDKGGAVLQLELTEHLPFINGDRIQLQQVILNLLRNALAAMSGVNDRPRRVVIRTEREDNDRVRLSVRDAGVGLDPGDIHRLFDAFYSKTTGGMGVGLSISRSIIERHQGRLWAERNDDHGATFSFSIPCCQDEADSEPSRQLTV